LNIVISLDYEVFFGSQADTRRSLFEPTEALCRLASRHGVPLVVFADVLWLLRMQELAAGGDARLQADAHRAARQLESMARAGHELQLHLHPHWLDCGWSEQGWQMDLRRYRLHDHDDPTITSLVQCGVHTLRDLSDGAPVSAFRAGGWCLQPFSRLRQPLLDAGIRIDSTVYSGGRQSGGAHAYDFTRAPALSRWRFDTDPLQPDEHGPFLEVPIASCSVSPLLYWRMAFARKAGLERHRSLGGGEPMRPARADLARKLLLPGSSVVSFDGLKSELLEPALADYRRKGLDDFVIIGHPKALTPHALDVLDGFLARHRGERYMGLNGCLHEAAPALRQRSTAGFNPVASAP
jgi:hypothetical protein